MKNYIIDSPVGKISLCIKNKQLIKLAFENDNANLSICKNEENYVVGQLTDYFKGKLSEFYVDYKLQGTEFQEAVWREIAKIPYGKTITYGELAKRINRPKAYRAVGQACKKNPIPIIIPCHRVIGTNSKLIGFASGTDIKKRLLEHEKNNPQFRG